MRCPKCGYNSFDHYLTCPKCRKDLAAVRRTLYLTAPAPGVTDFFQTADQRAVVPEPFLEPGARPTAFGPAASFVPAASLTPAFAATIILDEEVFDDLDQVEKDLADLADDLDIDDLDGQR